MIKSETVNINKNFNNNCRFRFRCDASGNYDMIYLDDIKINASGGETTNTGCTGKITGFSINPHNSALIASIGGKEFCTDKFASADISIRAHVSGAHQSLKYTIQTPQGTWINTENIETYDSKRFWATAPGTYIVSAKLYSHDNLGGTLCDSRTVRFKIKDCSPAYDCPGLSANIGDACNDGNVHTENDVINHNCQCVGTPIVPVCNVKDVKVVNNGSCPVYVYRWETSGDVYLGYIHQGANKTFFLADGKMIRVIDTTETGIILIMISATQ